ncbi:uracil-DNA glycosylase, partial [Paracoccus salipaludis]
MTADPTWKGMPLDAETALALLEWQREMGVDEPIGDAPVDRYAEPLRPPGAAPGPAPAAPPP